MAIDRIDRTIKKFPQEVYTRDPTSTLFNYLKSFTAEFELLDIEITGLLNAIQIDTATGTDLNTIGALFKIVRTSGETDDQLRSRIKSFVASFIGGGTVESLKSAMADILSVLPADITLVEFDDMKVRLEIDLTPLNTSLKQTLVDTADKTKAAGIAIFFVWTIKIDEQLKCTDSILINGVTPAGFFEVGASFLNGNELIT